MHALFTHVHLHVSFVCFLFLLLFCFLFFNGNVGVVGVQRCDEVYDTVLMPSTGGARTQFVAPLKLSQKSLFFLSSFFFFFCQINI